MGTVTRLKAWPTASDKPRAEAPTPAKGAGAGQASGTKKHGKTGKASADKA